MKVAFAAWLYCHRQPSGASRRAAGLLRALAEQLTDGDRITVLHGTGLDPCVWTDASTATTLDWREVPIPPGPTLARGRAERRVLPAVLREIRADIVELGAMPVPPGLPCRVALTLHDLRDLDGLRRRLWPRAVTRALIARSLRRCGGLATPSQFTADRLAAHGLLDATAAPTVIPGGVDRGSIRLRAPESVEPRTVLHVGHLEHRKNLSVLIEALAALRSSGHQDFRLRLLGADHGAGRSLEALANRCGVISQVSFEGAVREEVLRTAYRTTSIVAIPSHYEGFGLPALEALAVGAPVVVRDSGALPEVVGDAGRILDSDDPSDWATAFEACLNEGEAAAGLRITRALRLCWDTAAERTLAYWRDSCELST